MILPYVSLPRAFSVTFLPKTSSEVACLAFVPKAWPFSGQSMPVQSDAFSAVVVQHFDRVTIENAYDSRYEILRR